MYPITSRFLERESFRDHGHLGIDYAMPEGTPLRSIQDGVVVQITHLKDNIGNGVLVKWNDGKTAIYGHMSKVADNLHIGDHVQAGELIGYSGHSGHVVGNPGNHLHFGLKEGERFIDPSPYTDQIQNMNNPEHLRLLAEHVGHHIEQVSQVGFTLADLFKGQMQTYTDIFHALKLNVIHCLSWVDYTSIFQHLGFIFRMFFG